jgi:hypothetical protein
MALQLDLPSSKTTTGVAAPEAYARIVQFVYDARANRVTCYVDTHASQATREAGKSPVAGGAYAGIVGVDMPNLDASIAGVRTELYTWLKTLPDFAGATDV